MVKITMTEIGHVVPCYLGDADSPAADGSIELCNIYYEDGDSGPSIVFEVKNISIWVDRRQFEETLKRLKESEATG